MNVNAQLKRLLKMVKRDWYILYEILYFSHEQPGCIYSVLHTRFMPARFSHFEPLKSLHLFKAEKSTIFVVLLLQSVLNGVYTPIKHS